MRLNIHARTINGPCRFATDRVPCNTDILSGIDINAVVNNVDDRVAGNSCAKVPTCDVDDVDAVNAAADNRVARAGAFRNTV